MSAAEIARRYVETINERDPSGFTALFAEDAVLHDPFFPEPTRGREALLAMIEGILRAFPDMTWEQIGEPIDAGDRAAIVVAIRATNDGPLPMPTGELPATGKSMAYDCAVLWTFTADGLISEERSYFDATGVAAQLGLTG